MFFLMLQLVIFLLVIFIDLFKFIFVLAGLHFNERPPTEGETSLNLIVRMTQIMVGFLICCLSRVLCAAYQETRRKREEANKLLKTLN